MEDRYFPDGVSSDDTLVMWARDRFGEHAGYANQLLFHAERDADTAPGEAVDARCSDGPPQRPSRGPRSPDRSPW